MIPILVTGPGRSGTTLLMGILAHLPQVCVAELIPYETKLLSYYATAYHTLNSPQPGKVDASRSAEKEWVSVGFNPFNDAIYNSVFHDKTRAKDFFGNFVPMEIHPIFAKIIDEYYQRLSIDQGKLAPIYFAEKSNDIDRGHGLLLVSRFRISRSWCSIVTLVISIARAKRSFVTIQSGQCRRSRSLATR